MTILGWVGFGFALITAVIVASVVSYCSEQTKTKIIAAIIAAIFVLAVFGGEMWYFNSTASGRRSLVDERSNLTNGLDRTVTVYTADGSVIAQYSGRIDLEEKEGGYVKFDFDGKRYIYYNCFVESVADIENGR